MLGLFLVVEVLPFLKQATILRYDSAGKEVEISQCRRFKDFYQLKFFLENLKNKDDYSIVLSLGSEEAATDYIFKKFSRKEPERSVDDSELEGLITQLVGQTIHSSDRPDHSFTLDQVRIKSVMIGGHRTADPTGLSGKDFAVHLSRTFAKPALVGELKSVLPADKLLLIGETGPFCAHVISQINSQPPKPFLLIPLFYDSAPVFLFRSGAVRRLNILKWGEKNLVSTLFGNLAVNQQTAREIIQVFCRGDVSKSLARKISSFWSGEFRGFSSQLERFLDKERINQIYIMPFFNFPSGEIKFRRRVDLRVVDDNFVGQKLGLGLNFKSGALKPMNNFATVATLVELNCMPTNNTLNKIASRRVRWHEA